MISLSGVSYAYPYREGDAVTDLRLHVRPGEAVLCTGPSGCGKSTLLRLVNGLCPHFFGGRLRGRVRVNGQNNAERRLGEIARDVGTLFQDPEQQFFALTVSDEIAFAHEWRETDPATIRQRVSDAVDRFGLNHRAEASIHALSEGEKQKIALAAVMSLAPRALVLDEPSANLDPEAAADLAEEIGRLKRAGMAILIVDHRLYWLAGVADRAVILDRGRVAEEVPFSRLADPGLRTRWGLRADRAADVRNRLCPARGGPNDLQVADLRFAHPRSPALFEGISFSLPRGRIAGVFGPNGAGKTTLARLLTGLSPMDCGRLSLDGEAMTPRALLRRAGIVLQNADHQLHMKTVRREAVSAAHSLSPVRRAAAADEILRLFGLEDLADRHPQSLSGGEKQRLVIACGMVKRPDILILDEPTSGLDGRNMRRIALAMRRAADQGACVLLISHDLELIAESCDGALHLPCPPPPTGSPEPAGWKPIFPRPANRDSKPWKRRHAMFDSHGTIPFQSDIQDAAARRPQASLDELGRIVGVPEGAVAAALADEDCVVISGDAFERAWAAMTEWERATFIVRNPSAIVEVRGPLPPGRFGHGFFNIGGEDAPLGGHLRADRLAAIVFLSKPFMGMESHSVRFYDADGELMFAVYAGRNGREVIPSVREAFFQLRRLLSQEAAAKSIPGTADEKGDNP
mgnify:FL=1